MVTITSWGAHTATREYKNKLPVYMMVITQPGTRNERSRKEATLNA